MDFHGNPLIALAAKQCSDNVLREGSILRSILPMHAFTSKVIIYGGSTTTTTEVPLLLSSCV